MLATTRPRAMDFAWSLHRYCASPSGALRVPEVLMIRAAAVRTSPCLFV